MGGVVTVTGTVTVNNPDKGDKALTSTITTAAAGSNCPLTGGSDPLCSVSVKVPELTITQTANTTLAHAVPGQQVTYTIVVHNTGQTPYTGITVADSLAEMLDDASYDTGSATATATTGATPALTYNDTTVTAVLTWTGNVGVGASVTITYSVHVNNPDTGDKLLISTVTSTAVGSTCPPGTTDPACRVTIRGADPGADDRQDRQPADRGAGRDRDLHHHRHQHRADSLHRGHRRRHRHRRPHRRHQQRRLPRRRPTAPAPASTISLGYNTNILTWTGDLATGAAVTITYTVIVNSGTAGRSLTNTVTSPAAGSTCVTGTEPGCTATVAVVVAPGTLTFTNQAGVNTAGGATAGAAETYTITVANAAASPYTGASFSDDLTGVLAHASYISGSATASDGGAGGTVVFTSTNLTWSGDVPASGSVTITFTVAVSSAVTSSTALSSTLTSASDGTNCPQTGGTGDPRCSTSVGVAQLAISASTNVTTTTPGGMVRYTFTFTNTGSVPYTGITIASDAAGRFGAAVPNGDGTVSCTAGGSPCPSGPGATVITTTGASWVGDIPVGGVVTVSGTVTVNNPVPPGHTALTGSTYTAAPGSNCPTAGLPAPCSTTVTIPALTITKTADTTTAVPGQTVTYTITVHNTGGTGYTGATVTDSLADMIDDATYVTDSAADGGVGAVTYDDTTHFLTWTGDLPVGAAVIITYSVHVNNPDTGDKLLINTVTSADTGSTCPPATTDPVCRTTIVVQTPALTITKTASTPATTPGDTVTYTITAADTGQTPYTGATLTDDLTGVTDEAAYQNAPPSPTQAPPAPPPSSTTPPPTS